jgi:transcriptional regulator with XRE-family HTH domain
VEGCRYAKIRPFGQRLRPAREARDVTRKQLAAILGVAQGTIVNWEINGAEPTART